MVSIAALANSKSEMNILNCESPYTESLLPLAALHVSPNEVLKTYSRSYGLENEDIHKFDIFFILNMTLQTADTKNSEKNIFVFILQDSAFVALY